MAGGNGMPNGQYGIQQAQQTQPGQGAGSSASMGVDTPLAVVNPITITPALAMSMIKWVSGAVVSVVAILSASNGLDRYLKPARDSEFQTLRSAFELVQKEQAQSRDALTRLTTAVDNLAGIVNGISQAPQQIQRALPRAQGRAAAPR